MAQGHFTIWKKIIYESKFQLLGNDSRLFLNLKDPNYSRWKNGKNISNHPASHVNHKISGYAS